MISISSDVIQIYKKVCDETIDCSVLIESFTCTDHNRQENRTHLEKVVLMQMIDRVWVDHIEGMEYLRDSVSLRAYGQRDPLVEYKIEAQKMYDRLLSTIQLQAAHMLFKVNFVQQPQVVKMKESRPEIGGEKTHKHQQTINEPVHRGSVESKGQIKNTKFENVGRNDLCPCGSGKKFKKCHGK